MLENIGGEVLGAAALLVVLVPMLDLRQGPVNKKETKFYVGNKKGIHSLRFLFHAYSAFKKRRYYRGPDQGHLYPNLEVPRLTCPGRDSNPGLPRGKRAL